MPSWKESRTKFYAIKRCRERESQNLGLYLSSLELNKGLVTSISNTTHKAYCQAAHVKIHIEGNSCHGARKDQLNLPTRETRLTWKILCLGAKHQNLPWSKCYHWLHGHWPDDNQNYTVPAPKLPANPLPNKTDTLDNLIHLPFPPYGRSPERSPQMTMSKTLALMPNPATIYVLMSISTNQAGTPRDVHQADGPLWAFAINA